MSRPKVFLDSGIFVALLNRRDRRHAQAVTLFSGPRVSWCTSALVRAEAYSFFLHRYGEEAARSFRLMLDSLEGLVVHDTSPARHEATCRILQRLRGAKLTYVDAASLALLEEHGVEQVWATDHHLGLTGVPVLPRG